MSTSVYVLYRNTSNNFNHIMTQFKNQNYVNKYLVVFDSINSERPQELSNVIYVNPQADMKMEISNTETQMKGVTQTRKDLVDLLDKKLRYKVELEKSVEKLYEIFCEIDRDGSGEISHYEFFRFFRHKRFPQRSKFSKKVFKAFDLDGSGEIDFQEFVLCLFGMWLNLNF